MKVAITFDFTLSISFHKIETPMAPTLALFDRRRRSEHFNFERDCGSEMRPQEETRNYAMAIDGQEEVMLSGSRFPHGRVLLARVLSRQSSLL